MYQNAKSLSDATRLFDEIFEPGMVGALEAAHCIAQSAGFRSGTIADISLHTDAVVSRETEFLNHSLCLVTVARDAFSEKVTDLTRRLDNADLALKAERELKVTARNQRDKATADLGRARFEIERLAALVQLGLKVIETGVCRDEQDTVNLKRFLEEASKL